MSEQRAATAGWRTYEEIRAGWPDVDTPEWHEGVRQAHVDFEFGGFVYRARVAVGMSRIELGKHLGMRGADVQGMEEGGVSPTLEFVERVTSALGLRLHLVAVQDGIDIERADFTRPEG